jgi:hypothetical protein
MSELENLRGEIAFLKQQILAKDEMITFLKNQLINGLQQQMQPVPQPIAQPIAKNTEFCLDTYLNETCKDAINFNELFTDEYFLNPDKNKWIRCVSKGEQDITILKYHHHSYYPKSDDLATNIVCGVINNIEHNKRPVFCSDVKRGTYWWKMNDKWEIVEEKILFKKFCNKVFDLLLKAKINTLALSEKNFKYVYNADKKIYLDVAGDCKLSVILYGIELDTFTRKCSNKLAPLISRKQAKFVEEKAHDWKEFEDDGAKSEVEDDDE